MPPESGLDAAALTAASPWGLPVEAVTEITSTNDELLQRGEAGAPEGTVLFAESQTAGRGQFQRPWNSATGLGLWFSLLLRLEINDATIPLLSAFPAVALVETLRSLGIGSTIKAPNDVLIDGRKVAGILVETRPGKNPFAVIGIGLNVNHAPGDFPGELKDRVTSLALVAGSHFDRNTVAASLIKELGNTERLMLQAPDDLLAAWKHHLVQPHKPE
jgi:BirA family transcriptional regulator, biotin operon repressor / biotin---[acetyl-CoA-carboxylase] ligase